MIKYQGSCLCGSVKFHLLSEPKAVTNCHCRMCQKQHGAAFATYISVPRTDFDYVSGEDVLSIYDSSTHIQRKFCRICGSNIEWSGSPSYPEWVSIAVALLDDVFEPKSIKNVYVESKRHW